MGTDYSVKMSGEVIGVSVTRAMKYKGIFNRVDAEKLLRKKLFGINESTLGVTEPELVRNTLIMVTVTNSWWIFYQDKYIKAKDKAMKKKVIRKEMNKTETMPLTAAVT